MTRRAEFKMIKAALPGDRQCGFLRLKEGIQVEGKAYSHLKPG